MVMQILIADADPASAFATRRLLTRELGCATVEVSNGLDALHEISHRTFAALVLACDLPGISSFEVISSLRACPDTTSLPIVALASERTEGLVRELARHGVRYCLAKPLDVGYARARLQGILDSHHARRARLARRSPSTPLEVPDGSTVVIADADADFRHFFASLFASRFRVVSASSGAEALKVVNTTQPAVLCTGDHLGPLDRRMLVQQLHQARSNPLPLLLAVTKRANVDALHDSGLYDGVLTRTFVPSRFQEQFDAFVGRPTALHRLLERAPGLRGAMLSATEQACGMLMGLEIEATTIARTAGEGFAVIVQMAVRVDDDAVGLKCTVSAPAPAAAMLGARMLGAEEHELSDEDLVSVLGELANIVTGRIQNALHERGLPARCGLPKLSPGREPLVAPPPPALETHFRFPSGDIAVCVDLVGVASADTALLQALSTTCNDTVEEGASTST